MDANNQHPQNVNKSVKDQNSIVTESTVIASIESKAVEQSLTNPVSLNVSGNESSNAAEVINSINIVPPQILNVLPTSNTIVPIGKDHGYPIYMVNSSLPISQIPVLINKVVPKAIENNLIGPIRIIYSSHKGEQARETTGNLAIIHSQVYDILVSSGYGDPTSIVSQRDSFCIQKFELSKGHYPKEGEKTNTLYVLLPNDLSSEECAGQIASKLQEYARFGIIDMRYYGISVALKSRECAETHKGGAFLKFFDANDDVHRVALIRLLLQDNSWLHQGGIVKYRYQVNWTIKNNSNRNLKEKSQYNKQRGGGLFENKSNPQISSVLAPVQPGFIDTRPQFGNDNAQKNNNHANDGKKQDKNR